LRVGPPSQRAARGGAPEVQKLSQDPLAQQAASTDTEAARNSLQQADTALQQKKPPEK